MIKKKALVIGSRGMDASNLIKFLLEKNYEVVGTDRRSSSPNYWRHDELGIRNKFRIETMDITDSANVSSIINEGQYDEIYSLGAMSFVGDSFHSPASTFAINANGHLNVLEAVRVFSPKSKVYFAATSELYGKVQEIPQTEKTPFRPRSPYAVAKLAGFELTRNYRESYGLFACSGILFNHTGILRGEEFVTRKITSNIAKWKTGKIKTFELGNLDAKRDWGSSEDYVEGMWLMLQQKEPDDFILSSGETHSIREVIDVCLNYMKVEFAYEGSGIDEKVIIADSGYPLITINKDYFRPAEVDILIGSYDKAKRMLGWEPKTRFEDIICDMMDADVRREMVI